MAYIPPDYNTIDVVVRSDYIPPAYDSINVVMVDVLPTIITISNAYPKDNLKVYGLYQNIEAVVTISGSSLSYLYDTDFFDGGGKYLGTVSGTTSGQKVSVSIPTTSGVNYYWYLTATSSGTSENSPIYSFYVRYLCSGICTENDTTLSGVDVRLHRRQTGELMGKTTTAGTGTFTIDSSYNEEHYAIALHPSSTTNALIFDRIKPS